MIESMEVERLRERARIHAALADPNRLAIVDRLGWTDAAPSQLADSLSLETNLLAHHLAVLEAAGLIERVRSQGDQRRRYRLRRAALDAIARPYLLDARRVVFVCTENAARSQLAQAIWNHQHRVPAVSGGTRPAERVHAGALQAARRRGLSLRSRPAPIPELNPTDLVITVCDRANEHLGDTPGARLHWSIPDPATSAESTAYDSAAEQLSERIDAIAANVQPGSGRRRSPHPA
jgi:protein-tyrosine-phosphatase